jgi:type II secretory pathway component PulK
VALILVIFVVALASILVISLTYSVYLESRLNAISERSIKAEYILKSGISLARVLIREDTSPEDAPQDPWGAFVNGAPVPIQLLGIEEPNLRIELEIRPEEAKMPLRDLVPISTATPDKRWRDALTRLFQRLGFDNDGEKDHTGLFQERFFNSEQMVANLIDYLDGADTQSYTSDDFAQGIESDLPEGYFPTERITGTRLGELAVIPGFTPARLRKLTPFVTLSGNNRVNINLAADVVILALHEDISEDQVRQILEFRGSEDGPFNTEPDNPKTQLEPIVGENTYREITNMITVGSTWFQVLAKVDYGTSTYFMRTYLSKTRAGTLPVIRSVELF